MLIAQFISDKFFNRVNRKNEPKKPLEGPIFRRPDGVRDPSSEERQNLFIGTYKSWCAESDR